MTAFRMKIAGQVGQIHPLFISTEQYCKAYVTQESAHFSVAVTRDDLVFEQAELDEEARLEGFRRRQFTDPFLERAAIQRAFAERLFDLDTLLVHGSCVAVDGKAYLFTARSGTGKSTHTRLWREVFGDRTIMVNDDKPFLQITPEGIFACGSPWSGKHGLDANVRLPLAGICILERGAENRISPIAPADAMAMLNHASYHPMDASKHSRLAQFLDSLTQRTPLWKMQCTRDPAAAQLAQEAMSHTK